MVMNRRSLIYNATNVINIEALIYTPYTQCDIF